MRTRSFHKSMLGADSSATTTSTFRFHKRTRDMSVVRVRFLGPDVGAGRAHKVQYIVVAGSSEKAMLLSSRGISTVQLGTGASFPRKAVTHTGVEMVGKEDGTEESVTAAISHEQVVIGCDVVASRRLNLARSVLASANASRHAPLGPMTTPTRACCRLRWTRIDARSAGLGFRAWRLALLPTLACFLFVSGGRLGKLIKVPN